MLKIFAKSARTKPLALVGCADPELFPLLDRAGFRLREAWSTRGVLEGLEEDPHLVVLDPGSLAESSDLPRALLLAALESSHLPVAAPSQILAEGPAALSLPEPNRPKGTGLRFLPPRVLLFCSYAGGVGKTTLGLAAARHFRQGSGLPTALVEVGLGGSALQARLGDHLPSLYRVITENASPGQWQGVDLYPLDGREAQALAGDGRLGEGLRQIARSHTLTVLDVSPLGPLWEEARALATDLFLVASPRPEALVQAEALRRELADLRLSYAAKPKFYGVLNMVRTFGEKLMPGDAAAVYLPYDERRAAQLAPSLGQPLIAAVYPGFGKRRAR